MPVSGLPAGTYTLYFGVDTVMDGDVTWDSGYYDSISMEVATETTQLVQPSDLVYQGVFRLPEGPEEIGWEYGGQGDWGQTFDTCLESRVIKISAQIFFKKDQ